MRAIHIVNHDGPDHLELVEVPRPDRGDNDVLVEVHAAGVSFPEVLQSRGRYQVNPPLPFIPGSEVAGIVVEAPPGSGVNVGDRVAGFCLLGGFADLVALPADRVFPLPDTMSFEAGAALPLNYLTAHFALVERGRLAPGETVLVHGAAGGVGTASIQTARAFGAGRIIAVTSTDGKGEVATSAGAHEYVLAEGFKDSVKKITEGQGVDIVVDPVGGDRFTDSLRCLAEGGRILVIGFTEGNIPEVKVNRLLLNNLDVVGVGWGAFSLQRPGHMRAQWDAIWPHLVADRLTPLVEQARPLEEATDALIAIDRREVRGKLVLLP